MVFFCAAQERAAQPPEAAEYIAAMRIENPEARIEKLESIIAKYPESPYRGSMEFAITNARIELCRTVEDVLELQKAALEGREGLGRLSFLSRMAAQILDHGNLEMFDKAETIHTVLEYHLPIPGPDPMMNPATGLWQDVYDVRSTPTVVIDGDNDREYVGGGSRGMAGEKFGFYAAEIAARLYEEPVLIIEAEADRNAEVVKVEFSTGPLPSRAELHVALVQREERYKGSNGLVFHKMVVRDLITAPRGAGEVRFLLDASENTADRYLTEFEQTNTRSPNFHFAERKAKIDRDDLLIVVFVQDKETRQVLNAAVADVH